MTTELSQAAQDKKAELIRRYRDVFPPIPRYDFCSESTLALRELAAVGFVEEHGYAWQLTTQGVREARPLKLSDMAEKRLREMTAEWKAKGMTGIRFHPREGERVLFHELQAFDLIKEKTAFLYDLTQAAIDQYS
jgi:hypothetical protein